MRLFLSVNGSSEGALAPLGRRRLLDMLFRDVYGAGSEVLL